jgi:hypothetical protein
MKSLSKDVLKIILGWVHEFKEFEYKEIQKCKSNYDLVMEELYISGDYKSCKLCSRNCLKRRYCCTWVCEYCELVCNTCGCIGCNRCIDLVDSFECEECMFTF